MRISNDTEQTEEEKKKNTRENIFMHTQGTNTWKDKYTNSTEYAVVAFTTKRNCYAEVKKDTSNTKAFILAHIKLSRTN